MLWQTPKGIEVVPFLIRIIPVSRKKISWHDVGAVERRCLRGKKNDEHEGTALSPSFLELLSHDGRVLLSFTGPLEPHESYRRLLGLHPCLDRFDRPGSPEPDPVPEHMGIVDWIVCALLSLTVIGGAILFGLGLPGIWTALSTTKWPTVPGVVIQAGASPGTSQDSPERRSGSLQSAGTAFSYKVNGNTYTTDQFYFGQIDGAGSAWTPNCVASATLWGLP